MHVSHFDFSKSYLMSNEELIPVPWGHITAKTWGEKESIPVLVIHGLQDNCGSFDELIPFLPKAFFYFCIDLPGHGKSSHFPSGIPLDFFNYVYSVKLMVDYLRWSKFILLGHSLGAQISVFFSSIYPELVTSIVLIDGLTPVIIPNHRTVSNLRNIYNNLQKLQTSIALKKRPSYTYEEALRRIIENRPTHINQIPAEHLIKRCLIPSGDGFMFSTDQRLKLKFRPTLTMDQMKSIISNNRCPSLMIIAEDTYQLLDTVSEELYHERLNELFLKMPNFSFVLVKGNHDVHMNYPERIAPHISKFLLNQLDKSKL